MVSTEATPAEDDTPAIWPVRCATHRPRPAVALCTTCRDFLCSDCRSLRDDGRALCPSCAREAGVATADTGREGLGSEHFLDVVLKAVKHPRRFAAEIPLRGRLGRALLIGLGASYVGQLFGLLWQILLNPEYDAAIRTVAAESDMTVQQSHLVILLMWLPILAVFRLFFLASLLQLGTTLAQVARPYRYRAYLTIMCYASVSQLFLLIPLVGPFLALWYVVMICWNAQHIHHELDSRKTLFAVLPVAIGIILLGTMPGG